MEYNKEESERQAASQKEQEKMLESIKASITAQLGVTIVLI